MAAPYRFPLSSSPDSSGTLNPGVDQGGTSARSLSCGRCSAAARAQHWKAGDDGGGQPVVRCSAVRRMTTGSGRYWLSNALDSRCLGGREKEGGRVAVPRVTRGVQYDEFEDRPAYGL